MITATQIGAIETPDVVELLPAVATVTSAVSEMTSAVTTAIDHVTTAVDRLSDFPQQFVREAKAGVREVSYTAGRGFGWGLLPPVLIGFGVILAGLLAYRYAAIRIDRSAGLEPVTVSGQAFFGQLRRRSNALS